MTKQEYESKIKDLQSKYKCDSDYYQGLVDVDNNYIASLEAQVAKLEKVVEKAAKLMNDSSGSCPMDMYDYCVFDADRCPTDCNYTLCWKTWLMEEK